MGSLGTRLYICSSLVWKSKVILSRVSIILLNLHYWRGSYALCGFIRYSCIYETRMSLTLNESSLIRRFKHSNVIKMCDRITFDCYMWLAHTYIGEGVCMNKAWGFVRKITSTTEFTQQLLSPLNWDAITLIMNACSRTVNMQQSLSYCIVCGDVTAC